MKNDDTYTVVYRDSDKRALGYLGVRADPTSTHDRSQPSELRGLACGFAMTL